MRISDWSSDVCSSDLHANGKQQADSLATINEPPQNTNQQPHGEAAQQVGRKGAPRIAGTHCMSHQPAKLVSAGRAYRAARHNQKGVLHGTSPYRLFAAKEMAACPQQEI